MVAGIGCRAGVSGEQVEAAIAAALAALHVAATADEPARTAPGPAAEAAGLTAEAAGLTAIAAPAAKAHEPGIQSAAAARGVPLLAIAQSDLAAANSATVTRSAQSMAAMNVHSVAEAAALAGAATLANATLPTIQSNMTPRLLQPRVAVGPVTCALADTTLP
jgi:cobalt-precorrin 5A hydrolase